MSAESNSEFKIFTEALQLPPAARPEYIDRTCAGDENLHRKVQALLRANDRAGRFLEELPTAFAGERVQQVGAIEKPGDRIGRYQLLKQIGEGGWGIVFLAEQKEPVRRQVALKVIKPGMDTKSVIARFEAERQALALMNYPHIARVLDAGATETGRPFFVMELVSGIKITEFCDQKALTTRERLELFIKVCGAIQYAHQKGIIHRDVKPSNILVDTASDGTTFPMVIDFGIIKATTNQPLLHNTSLTANEALIGTPAYMSPEQAAHLDIDTRADIYSLGVLLYELLTGTTPFDSRTLVSMRLDEIRRVISTEDPLRPSTRLKAMSLPDLRSHSQRRQADSAKLMREVRGDLDWIVTKALEKDRARRYATANGLAMDVQRYLAAEPIIARPPSTIYRVLKLMRRNKLAFAAGSTIAAMLFLGIAASLWQARRAWAAERQATAKADDERAAREESESILKFMTEVFQSPDPNRDGRTITVADELDRATKRLEIDLANQPDRMATLQATLASTYYALGLAGQAIPLQEKVRDYHQRTLGLEHPKTLADMGKLASFYFDVGRRGDALKLREEVLALSRKVNGLGNTNRLVAMRDLANSYFDAGRQADAFKLGEEVLSLSRKINESEYSDTLVVVGDLASSYFDAGRKAEAIELEEEVLTLSRKVRGSEHPDTLVAMGNLAFSYAASGRIAEGIKLQEEVLTLSRKVNGPEHVRTLNAMNNLAITCYSAGRLDEAVKLLEQVLTLSRKVRGSEHSQTLVAMDNLAITYFSIGRKAEAIKLQEEVLVLSRKVRGSEHPDTLVATGNLATFYSAAGRKNEAIKLREEALALSLRQGTNSTARAAAYAELGFSLDAVGRSDEAIKDWQEAVRISPSGTQNAAYWLGKALVDRQRYGEALPVLRATQKFYPDGDRGRETAGRLALAEGMVAGQGKAGASDRALAALRQTVAANPADTDKAKQLATVYLWLGQTNEHLAVCRKLLDLAENSTDPSFHDRAAKAYLIQAQPDPQTLKQAVASARQALKLAATNDSNRAWFLVTAAMAAVRDGRPAEADSILDDALKVAGADLTPRSLALAYRALEKAHLGRTEEARANLGELEKLLPGLPTPGAPSAIVLQPDFLAVCLAHEEAKALLNPPPAPSKP
jgi:serine/threonine protein kinase/Icc-related predicted phosphoesterase